MMFPKPLFEHLIYYSLQMVLFNAFTLYFVDIPVMDIFPFCYYRGSAS